MNDGRRTSLPSRTIGSRAGTDVRATGYAGLLCRRTAFCGVTSWARKGRFSALNGKSEVDGAVILRELRRRGDEVELTRVVARLVDAPVSSVR